MAVPEDELLPLSALQHFIYCERQAALIHVEQVWIENVWTVEGGHLHENVISGEAESRGDLRIARDLSIRSLRLGVTGRADVIEFHRVKVSRGVEVAGLGGRWRPFPVEYKRGQPKHHSADEVQLCAQALCLEEMLDCEILKGALFYGQPRRRLEVTFDAALRDLTESAARGFREMFMRRETPPAVYERWKCQECSLLEICRPRAAEHRVDRYLETALEGSASAEHP